MTEQEVRAPGVCGIASPAEAAGLVRPGSVVMVGGFGLVGAPLTVLDALAGSSGAAVPADGLTVISNNLGESGRGLGRLLLEGRVRKAVGSFFTSNPDAVRWHSEGRLEVELMPQGTLAESIRAGGAGIGGFYVRTGVGTELARGHEERLIRGESWLYYEGMRADVALIRAHVADELGNLVYSKTARNFNPLMAAAADLVIAEVDRVVPVGTLDPEAIITPHPLVDRLVLAEVFL
jgi:3-oxoacid CoA-transferase A subunit